MADPAEANTSPASYKIIGQIDAPESIQSPPQNQSGNYKIVGQIDQAQPTPGVGSRLAELAGGATGNVMGIPVPASIEAGLGAIGAAINPNAAVGPQGEQVRQQAAAEVMGNMPRAVRPIASGFASGIGSLTALMSRALGNVTPGLSGATQGEGVAGLVNSLEQGRQANGTSTAEDLAAKGAEIGTQVAMLGGAGKTLAPLLMAAQGAEGGLEQTKDSGVLATILNTGGQAALNFAMGKLLPGQKLNSAIIEKFAPELKDAAAGAIKRTLLQAGVQAPEGAIFQLASNAIQKLSGNDVSLTQGVGENALVQGVTGGALHGLGEIGSRSAASTETTAPPVPKALEDFQVKSREGENKGQVVDFPSPVEKAQHIVNNPGYRGPVVEEAKGYLQAHSDYQETLPRTAASSPESPKASFKPSPSEDVRTVAQEYAKSAKVPYAADTEYVPVDESRAKRIANWFDSAESKPNDPAVKAGYDALKSETKAQYEQMVAAGFKIEPWTGEGPAYKSSADMVKDVQQGKHLFYDPTAKTGFGGTEGSSDHPMMEDSGVKVNGQSIPFNDLFRAVHDFYGHAKEGIGFGPRGEENAWRQHMQMYSDAARPAMTSETRGQNSWVNYGPKGEANRANPRETTFADQKAVLAPDWVVRQGAPDLSAEGMVNREIKSQIEQNKKTVTKNESIVGRKAEAPAPKFEPDNYPPTRAGDEARLADMEKKASGMIEENRTTLANSEKVTGKKGFVSSLLSDESGGARMPTKDDLVGPGSVYHEEVKPHIDKLAHFVTDSANWFRRTYNPGGNAPDAATAKGTFRANMAKFDLEQRKAEVAFESARKGFGKLKQDQQWEFQEAMDGGGRQPTAPMQKIADAMYTDTNHGRQAIENLGVEAAKSWHEEWWNRLWKKDEKLAAQMATKFGQAGRLEGRAGFMKSRTIEDWGDALKNGLVPRYDNPVDMFLATKAERNRFIAAATSIKELHEAGVVIRSDRVPAGWERMTGTSKAMTDLIVKGDGKFVIVPKEVKEVIDNVTTPSAVGNKSGFRLLAEVNSTLTQLALGLSGFHLIKVGTESILSQIGRGVEQLTHGEMGNAADSFKHALLAPVEAAIKGKTIQEQLLGRKPASPQEQAVLDAMLEGGQRVKEDEAWKSHFRRRVETATNQGGVNGWMRAALNAPFALNEGLMQKVIFDYVQRAKLFHGFEQTKDVLTRLGPNASLHDIRAEAGKVSDHLDNVLGLMVRDNLLWNKTARDLATLSMLSVGWNYGAKRSLTRGVVEAVKGGAAIAKGQDIKTLDSRSAAYIASVTAAQALAGLTITYLATGHAPQSLVDYVFPDTGKKDKFGHPVRVRLPFYTGDWYDFLTDPIETLQHKASPIIHAATSLVKNKDYFGTKIRNEDDPYYRQALEVASYLGELGKPFSVRQLQDVISGKGSAATKGMEALPFVGIRFAAKKHSYSDAEQRARDLIGESLPIGGRTKEAVAHSQQVREYADGVVSRDPGVRAKLRAAVIAGDITKADIEKIKEIAAAPNGIVGLLKNSSLAAPQIMSVWDRMSPQEKKDTGAMVLSKLKNSPSINAVTRTEYIKQVIDEWKKVKASNG